MSSEINYSFTKNSINLFNYYAIELLEKIGNTLPKQYEIDVVETMLEGVCKKIIAKQSNQTSSR